MIFPLGFDLISLKQMQSLVHVAFDTAAIPWSPGSSGSQAAYVLLWETDTKRDSEVKHHDIK